MSSSRDNRETVRRSNRRPVPTLRGREYNCGSGRKSSQFPSVGDKIQVQWILGNRTVWWPTSVCSIDEADTREAKCAGEILYQSFEKYDEVRTTVVFSVSTSSERLVSSIDSHSKQIEGEPSS